MQKRTREIVALFLLVGLCIAGVCAMAWYILVGHNWNVAASNIDDHIGQLDQYTIVLVEGSSAYADDREEGDGEDKEPARDEARPVGGALEATGAGSLLDEDVVLIEAADAAYVGKGAHTVTVHPGNFDFYEDPVIVPRNGKRFAVYSVSGPLADLQSRFVKRWLDQHEVDFSICIIDNHNALSRGLGNVDVAICTDPEVRLKPGYIGRTYAMSAPYLSQVAAILIAPSGFISSKMLSGL